MKITKFLSAGLLITAMFGLVACSSPTNKKESDKKKTYTIEYEKAKSDYATLSIELKNIKETAAECYTNENGKITINAATAKDEEKDVEITLTGYFNGQIENKVKGLVINLKGAYLENTDAPVILGTAKTEISAKKDTVNYIIGKGEPAEKTGAVESAKNKNLEFGGAGTCYIVSKVCHGVKTDKAQFKGSGTYYIQGAAEGSDVNCNEFIIEPAKAEEPDKKVTIYFYSAKNGIKADKGISISNGNLFFYGTKTALKTDKAKTGEEPVTINLETCTITTKDVTTLYETDTYNKADTAKIVK